MILAREIAEGLIAIDYVVDTTSNGPWVVRYGAFELGSRFATKADAESACSQHRNRLTSLIAAKLEPVRDALDQWDKLTEQEDWFLDIDALGHAMEDTTAALAMLSDDEETKP